MSRLAPLYVLLIACGSTPPAAPVTGSSDSTQVPEPEPERAPTPESRTHVAAGAMKRCIAAVLEIRQGATVAVLSECADVFPGCAAAWHQLAFGLTDGEPFRSCGYAYCADLPEPRPALCAAPDLTYDKKARAELIAAIVIDEYYVDQEGAGALGALFAHFLSPQAKVTVP